MSQKHCMTTREEGQSALYDDAEDVSISQDITALSATQFSNSIMDLDGKTAAEYSEETATE